MISFTIANVFQANLKGLCSLNRKNGKKEGFFFEGGGRTKNVVQCKKKASDFPVPSQVFPARESLVSDIPAGDGEIVKLFLQCTHAGSPSKRSPVPIRHMNTQDLDNISFQQQREGPYRH